MAATEACGGAMSPVADGELVTAPTECEITGAMTAVPGVADFCGLRGALGFASPEELPPSTTRTGQRGRLAEACCCLRRTGGIPLAPGRCIPSREGQGSAWLSS